MKKECYIVRDLLPSYIDQLCSEESTKFIDQHMVECSSCTRTHQQMKADFEEVEQLERPMRIEQKKPFERVSQFIKAQGNFAKFLKFSFWLLLLITIVFLVFSLNDLTTWQEDQQEAQQVEQQQQEIMEKTFAAILAQGMPDETALQSVFHQYEKQLQHIAVFSSKELGGTEAWQQVPSTTFPIDYEKARMIVGEGGKITETIVPNEYDIGTLVMANNEWIIQFEYKESYLETVENAHQIKYYSSDAWELFSLPIVFAMITLFILLIWICQKRLMKPMETTIG